MLEESDIGVREVDFTTEHETISHFDGLPVKGVMTAKDESLMELLGSQDSLPSQMIHLELIQCTAEFQKEQCAEQEEIDGFFVENSVLIYGT